MNNECFIEDYLWIVAVVILAFTIYVAYLLNKNTDPSEIDEDYDDEDEEHYHL